jgi:hypothetical protein
MAERRWIKPSEIVSSLSHLHFMLPMYVELSCLIVSRFAIISLGLRS